MSKIKCVSKIKSILAIIFHAIYIHAVYTAYPCLLWWLWAYVYFILLSSPNRKYDPFVIVEGYIYVCIYMYIWHIITYSCPNLRRHVSIKETLDMSHWGNPKESSPMLSWVHYCKIWTQSSKQIKCDTPGSQYLWISLLELVRDWYKISRNTTYLFLIMCLHQDSGARLEVYSSLCLTKLCIISLLTSRDNVIIVMIIQRLNI